ncbi:MAG TPA: hypothetical protein ENI04_01210, partial [Candidatus Wildermuthbacteria bacterium]|nr:hypothetical protein [Candidatus Wildermuthbacteria bacterium]
VVEPHNLASQSYGIKDLGKAKAIALADQMLGINPSCNIVNYLDSYNGSLPEGGYKKVDIMVSAVDSMQERERICEGILKSKEQPGIIIDGRLGGPQLEIYTMSPKEWPDTFVVNPSQDPCGARYISYISMAIGALIANQVKRVLKEEKYHKSIIFELNDLQMLKS